MKFLQFKHCFFHKILSCSWSSLLRHYLAWVYNLHYDRCYAFSRVKMWIVSALCREQPAREVNWGERGVKLQVWNCQLGDRCEQYHSQNNFVITWWTPWWWGAWSWSATCCCFAQCPPPSRPTSGSRPRTNSSISHEVFGKREIRFCDLIPIFQYMKLGA